MVRLPGLASRLAALCLIVPAAAAGQSPPPPPVEEAREVALEQAPPPPAAQPGPPRWRLGVTLGAGTSSGRSYMMFGGLIGYELDQGFEAYLDAQFWGGANPTMGKLSPGLNWYAPVPFRPYVGAYYARWIIGGGSPDEDAVGGRFGATIASTPNSAFSAGMVYERILGCSLQCDAFWPELSFGFRF